MSDPTEMQHDPRCPAHGNPRWADVGECGPCESLTRTYADERRARMFAVGDRVRIRSYYPPRIPKWRVGDTGTVVRITRKRSVVVNVDGTEYSCPRECLEPVATVTA